MLSVACSVVGTLMVLNQPQDKDSDAQIAAYFASHSNRVHGMIGFFLFAAGILLLLAFLTALRERLIAAEGEPGRLSALVFGAGIATVPLWLVSMVLASAVEVASGIASGRFKLDPNLFRLLADAAYMTWVAALGVSALVVWGTSAVALRKGVLPRWFGWIGIAVGLSLLFGILFFPFFAWWAWLLFASILLASRREAATVRVAQPAV